MDGKDIRGSIEKGSTRGAATVLAVSHDSGETFGQKFYSGKKESEKTCVQELLSDAGLADQKITLDALHLSPKTTTQIEENKGVYVIGLKDNQQELLADMERVSQALSPNGTYSTLEKGHGRVEKRKYRTYSVGNEYFDSRWEKANFQTLIKVNRVVYDCKKKTEYDETAFYISNQAVKNTADVKLAQAIRGHWNVETNNHRRDVTFKEDKQRTLKIGLTARRTAKMLSTCRTLVINLLNRLKPANMVAQLELFSDDFKTLIKWLKEINFL